MKKSDALAKALAEKDRVKQKFGLDDDSDQRVVAWLTIAEHPFFADCYNTGGTLLDAVLAKLDAAHAHTCEPVWRPVTFEEIRAGWEIRAIGHTGFWMNWGTAHHQDEDGDWRTEAGGALTLPRMGWTYETTAPAPKPEPWPEGLVMELAGVISSAPGTVEDEARAALDALAARYPGVRAALASEEDSK